MRKVKIISTLSISKMLVSSDELQNCINDALRHVCEENGSIIKIKYGFSHSGFLETVVIEYSVPS
uniref:hypothetical protein n=1 Tax=Acetatifactor sp. TaxID=1872090 RepID=UPI0040569373